MNTRHAAVHTPLSREPDRRVNTRISSRWLVLARVTWLVLVMLSLGLFATAIVLYSAELSNPNQITQATLLHPDPSISGYIAFNLRFL